MAQINNGLQDIELPPEGVSFEFVVLGVVLILFLLSLLIWFYYKHQQPMQWAKSQLLALTDDSLNADNIVVILREGLQVKQLKDSSLPRNFIQRLEYARFSSEVCDTDTLVSIKNEALLLLTKAIDKQEKQ